MNKNKFYKLLFVFCIAILFILSVFNIFNIFSPNKKELISAKEITKIKTSLKPYTSNDLALKVTSIEGCKDYVVLTFVDTNYDSSYKTFNVLYSTKSNKVLTSIDSEDLTLSLIDASFIKYINDDLFLVLDAYGNLYTLNINSNKSKINFILSTGIDSNSLFKYLLIDKSLYLIGRDTISKYNERVLSNNTVLQLNFKTKKFNKADTISYRFNSDEFIYSFVINRNGDVGVVGSKDTSVLGSTVNNLLLPSDDIYVSRLPSENKHYKFIDTSSMWIRFLHDDSIINISEDDLSLEYHSIHTLVNKKLDLNISSPSNVPFFVGDSFTLYSSVKYEELLYNNPILSMQSILKKTTGEAESESISSIRSEIMWFNYKSNKYLTFIATDKGISGITKKGDIEEVINSTIGFINEDTSIYIEDGAVKYKKL